MEHIYTRPEFGEDWFTYPQLYRKFVEEFTEGTFVEVGSWKGKSIAFLAVEVINSKKKINIFSVDTWKGSEEHKQNAEVVNGTLYEVFLRNIEPIKDIVTPIRKPSIEAAKDFRDESIEVVFIDGAHDYESVKEDILAWFPKVKLGGILAGHDYVGGWQGVVKAVDEVFGSRVVVINDCWMIRKGIT